MLAAVEQLEVRTITETIEDWTITYRIIPIIADVEVHVYDESKQAVLIFNDSADSVEIEFSWTVEAAGMFDNIDTAEPIELLELLARLHRKLETDMRAVRKANGMNF